MAYEYTNPFTTQTTFTPGNIGWSPNYGMGVLPNNIQPTNDLIFVLDESAARSYPVGNGKKVTLWDKNLPQFYIKAVDMNGVPSFRKFKFEEILDAPPVIEPAKSVTDEYVTKADFDAFANKIFDKLNERHNYKKPQQNKEST